MEETFEKKDDYTISITPEVEAPESVDYKLDELEAQKENITSRMVDETQRNMKMMSDLQEALDEVNGWITQANKLKIKPLEVIVEEVIE